MSDTVVNPPDVSPEDSLFRSRVEGPIKEMSFLRQSLLFAELSWIAYFGDKAAEQAIRGIGLQEAEFFERDGAQAYSFTGEHDQIIACRGTEPTEWNDVKADLYALLAVAETVGQVHRGFKQEVDDLWPRIEERLIANKKTLWFTGHSLGGAMASICGGRCLLSHIASVPEAVFTYGSPRVGNKRYVNHAKINLIRWVNNNDIVPRVPPPWMGYRHAGREMYLDRHGKINNLNQVMRARDRWRGFLGGLKKWELDQFSDHSMTLYADYIYNNMIEAEKNGEDIQPPKK